MTPEAEQRMLELLEDILTAIKSSKVSGSTAREDASFAAPGAFSGWKAVRIPSWAKYGAGEPLGAQSEKGMAFWLRWQPRGWTKQDGTEMPPSAADLALRKALDEAQAEIETGTYVYPAPARRTGPAQGKNADHQKHDSAPSARRAQQNPDEDVPF